MIEIYTVSLQSFSDSTNWESLLAAFFFVERERILRFSRAEDRVRRIVSHLLVSTLVAEKLSLKYRDLLYKRGEYGRPYLGLKGAPSFNVSSSGNLVVAAIAHEAVGIDTERCEGMDRATMKLLLGQAEEKFRAEHASEEEQQLFYSRWTMLESWLKAEGTGLHDQHPLSSFAPEREGKYYRTPALEPGAASWVIEALQIQNLEPEPTTYALSVCRRPQEKPASEIQRLDGNELVRRFLMLL
ncbi:hypothetical protein B9G55_21530 [Saccharibacillus sp. O16]|nr:hypothetical protein B9G55_21530 [Saccharibacillus sp. O16]